MAQPVGKPTAVSSGDNPLRRVGLGLIIGGGLLAVAGLVLGGIGVGLLEIPAALLLITGLVLYLIGF
ncbi:hypothetical protein MUN84_05865 [Hymenobacter sp. 5516J-16]|uniref:hypothetical protein n=1 Tax=Hymenobacter sp. 5516J-16 TaxID=2932253 RepID=UPI001FCFAA39|nr:hypothetical protein [Hymenobacter sp. 5516J-16]UOQ78128.1 hypothetical protein MUN84_05865 [Hymenobacter sp. 5516J-16]